MSLIFIFRSIFFFRFLLFLYRITHNNLNENAKKISQSILIYIVSTYINKSDRHVSNTVNVRRIVSYDECNWIIGPLIELNWIRAKRLMYIDDAFFFHSFHSHHCQNTRSLSLRHTVSFYSHLLRKHFMYHSFSGLLLTIHEECVVASLIFSLINLKNFSGSLRFFTVLLTLNDHA